MNNPTYTTKNSGKQNISACGRSAQSRVKTQFQIEGGGLVQDVTKLFTTFSAFVT